jgi:hypothetical protein
MVYKTIALPLSYLGLGDGGQARLHRYAKHCGQAKPLLCH